MKKKNKYEALRDSVGGFKESTWIDDTKVKLIEEDWKKNSRLVAMRILRTLRSIGKNQNYLAEMMAVSPQQVSKWVKGSENFTFETISKIEHALQIELIEIISTPKPPSMKVFYLDQTLYHQLEFECKVAEPEIQLI